MRREKWRRDVIARQRNTVFPDTALNEARFWRNILFHRGKLGVVQVVGIGLIYATLAAVIYGSISTQLRGSDVRVPLWERIIDNFGIWIALLIIFAGVLLVGQLISRRSKHSRRS